MINWKKDDFRIAKLEELYDYAIELYIIIYSSKEDQ